MTYQKQMWNNYNDSLSVEQNLKNGAIVNATGLNHIEEGISELESNFKTDSKELRGYIDSKTYPLVAEHPFANNPVLTKESVTDRTAQGVADPFICYENGMYHMFFEVITDGAEEIGHAYSYDGLTWTYTQVVISELGEHFAYPLVIKDNGKWYMIPDKTTKLDIYEATNFPYTWKKTKEIFRSGATDATIFKFNNVWYMHAKIGNRVELFFNVGDLVQGNWVEHPKSPILNGAFDRGAGSAVVGKDTVVFPIQGYISTYGDYASWYMLSQLTEENAVVTKGPIFINGQRNKMWNERGMHHISFLRERGKEIIAVDGIKNAPKNNWSIGIYTESDKINVRAGVSAVKNFNVGVSNAWVTIDVGTTTGSIDYDTSYLWNRKEKVFEIPKTGLYKIKLKITDYGSSNARTVLAGIFNETDNSELSVKSMALPTRSQGDNHTLETEAVVYLEKGKKISAKVRSTDSTILIRAGSAYTFFELEKVD